MDLNKVMLIGNLTANPELKKTKNGQNVVSFSIATNRSYKDKEGQWVSQAEFHSVVAWAGLAERISQYCTKGKKVYIEGRMQTRTWDDNNGITHYKTEVVADNVIFLSKNEEKPTHNKTGMMDSVTEVQTKSSFPGDEVSIEDVPW